MTTSATATLRSGEIAFSHRPGLVGFALALALAGCARPEVVAVTRTAAVAPLHGKGIGTVRLQALTSRGELEPYVDLVSPGGRRSNVAQSGNGPLGDRLFRLDEHELLEGCRWVASGRICNLVTLPDGTVLGGSLNWMIPEAATATPGAGGWVTRGVVLEEHLRAAASGAKELSLRDISVVVGQVYHCRFTDAGPRCLAAPVTDKARPFVPLASLSLRDGAATRDVLWIGLVAPPPGSVVFAAATNIQEVHRCETRDDASEVTCKLTAMK
jgi:hypothetical protein